MLKKIFQICISTPAGQTCHSKPAVEALIYDFLNGQMNSESKLTNIYVYSSGNMAEITRHGRSVV